MRRDHPVRRWLPASALGVLAALAALPDTSAAATVDWSQSALRGVTDCASYRSVYHWGRPGCWWYELDRKLESALPKVCSLAAPLPIPRVSDPNDPNYRSVYTGDAGYVGVRIDWTITDQFHQLKAKFCRDGSTTTASAGSSTNASSSGGPASGSSSGSTTAGNSAGGSSTSSGGSAAGSGGSATVDWSQSALRGVTDCASYRSVYHWGRPGCWWYELDRKLESALPKVCSLAAPLPIPRVSDPNDPNYRSVYTGDAGYVGVRIDWTITDQFHQLKAKFCRGGSTTTASAGSSTNASSSGGPASGSSSGSTTAGNSAGSASTAGVNWLSGMHCWTASPSVLGAWRGRPLDVAQIFAAWDTWNNAVSLERSVRDFATSHPGMRLVLAFPLLTSETRNDFAGCAAGRYDARFARVARALRDNGAPNAIVRLGPEFNGSWEPYYAATDPVNFVRCFRRAVDVMRREAPGLLIEWPPNRAGRGDRAKALVDRYWPGDSYVDLVGLSFYDSSPAAKDEWTWNYWYQEELDWWANFVRQKGKKLAFGEWGILRTSDGFDNPRYIEGMFRFFSANRDILGYEIVRNCSSTKSQLYPADVNPQASATYRRLW